MDLLRGLLWLPGAVLVLAVLLDVLLSSLQAGEGLLSRWIHRAVYAAVRAVARWTARGAVLAWSTVALISGTLLAWTGLLWLGWTLVFWASPSALEVTQTGQPASFEATVYFVGYTLSTLGLGDVVARGAPWRWLTDAAAISGFFLLTFAITFIVPVAQARGSRQEFALRLYRAGPTAQAVVVNAARAGASGVQGLLNDLAPSLNALDIQHLNSPNLHRFHGRGRHDALDLALPVLGEALLMLGALQDDSPPGLRRCLDSVDSLTRSYELVHRGPDAAVPPVPDLQPLREAGLPLRPTAEFAAHLRRHEALRRRLHSMARTGHWDWQQVAPPAAPDG